MNSCGAEPMRSVWRRGTAASFAVYIDAADYFASLARNLPKAERRIFILGWDLDSRLELVPGNGRRLAAFLDELVRQRPALEIYILLWNPSLIYVLDREPLQSLRFLMMSPRVHVQFDGKHPVSGSHHQKLVIIDDQLAYSGGIDLAAQRWDTSEHAPGDPRRRAHSGNLYAPFHDCQAAVTGAPAAWLGELACARWHEATWTALPPATAAAGVDRFELGPAIADARLAIARTAPAFQGRPEVREVETLFLEMIGGARRYLYIENQYLTAPLICRHLRLALAKADGPEIVIVLPRQQDTLISRLTMGTMTQRAVDELMANDPHLRLRIMYPEDTRLQRPAYINVHAKVMVADDRLLRIGSANLNNRSMGLDTECDLLLDAGDDPARRLQVRQVLARFVADHLGADPRAVAATLADRGLRSTVDAFNGASPKTLEAFIRPLPELAAALARRAEAMPWADLPEVLPLERLVDDVVFSIPLEPKRRGLTRRSLLTIAATLLLAVALTAAAPLGLTHRLGLSGPGGAALLFAAFVVGGVLVIPLNMLMIAAASLLPPLPAAALMLAGSLSGALAGYVAGKSFHRLLPRRWLAGPEASVRRVLGKRNLATVLLVRLFPLAPFALVNLVGGLLRVPLGPYLAGTLLGMLPGVLGLLLFQQSLRDLLLHPSVGSSVFFAATAGVILLVLSYASRRFRAPAPRQSP